MAENPDLSLRHLLGDKFHPLQPQLILGREFEIMAVGGMGAGKTYAACVAAFRHAAKYPGARVLIGRFTYEEMVKTTKWAFFELIHNKNLEKYFIKPAKWDYREGTHYCRLVNGSEIMFSNLDKSVDKHKNVEYSMVVIDQVEEIAYATYQILMLRCRLTVCPPEERHIIGIANDEGDGWIRDRFVEYNDPHGFPDALLGRRLILGSSLDNPHLDEHTKRSYLLLPDALRERWVFATMKGGNNRLIPAIPQIEPFAIPRHWPRYMGIDPARSEGVTCAEFVTVNPDRRAYHGVEPNAAHIYAEYWGEHREIEDHVADLLRIRGPHHFKAMVMDQTTWATAVKSKKVGTLSIAQLYVNAGLPVVPSMGDEWTRVSLYINTLKRGLTISTDCKHLIEQAPKYRVKGQKAANPLDPTGFTELKIVAKAKYHSIDAGGYALSQLPARAQSVEIRPITDAIHIDRESLDDASIRHWDMVNADLPKRRGRESLVTAGFDEVEFFAEDRQVDPYESFRSPEEDLI